jgi:tetrahydromethanopterin S-methyltransferase subunit H
MKINGQHLNINIGPIDRLIFKYQELTRKSSELFFRYPSILIGSIFYHNIQIVKNHFAFHDN